MNSIPSSELIINGDGSVFHLHLKPEQLADTVILVGDPGRVETVSWYFSTIECRARNREFVSCTGVYKRKRLTVLSTGIGVGNIDIVLTELDALANVDFATRTVKPAHRTLNLVRVGTSGALQDHVAMGDAVLSEISIGFDGLLNFYAGRDAVCLADYEAAFVEQMQWSERLPAPYFVAASEKLVRLFADIATAGMTITAPGFYAPQGRVVRLPLADPLMNDRIRRFAYDGRTITNYEMEGAAIAGLARLLGHEAVTLCHIIADRVHRTANAEYKNDDDDRSLTALIEQVLEKVIELA
ncbi:MAG: nucleoside phosphorylase [Prevotellaceae bacterium]|nr:nucleoside phosphorylase [Prevotellaceae bacterium]